MTIIPPTAIGKSLLFVEKAIVSFIRSIHGQQVIVCTMAAILLSASIVRRVNLFIQLSHLIFHFCQSSVTEDRTTSRSAEVVLRF